MDTITIEISTQNALARHIEDLQRVITQRNQTIEQLKERLTTEGEGEAISAARRGGFRDGWKACSGQIMDQSRKTALSLGELLDVGFKAYLEGDRL